LPVYRAAGKRANDAALSLREAARNDEGVCSFKQAPSSTVFSAGTSEWQSASKATFILKLGLPERGEIFIRTRLQTANAVSLHKAPTQ
jgi:hypothetical protein